MFLRRLVIGGALLAAAWLLPPATGQVNAQDFAPGARQADIHNPFSPRYVDFRPNGYLRRAAGRGHVRIGGTFTFGYPGYGYGYSGYFPRYYSGYSVYSLHGPGYSFSYGRGVPFYLGSYDPYVSPYGGYYGGYPYYSGHYPYRSFVLPPLVLPADQIFGLGPIKRMLGAAAQPAPFAPLRQPLPALKNQDDPAEEKAKIERSHAAARERAWRFIGIGDGQFEKLAYRDAYSRYNKAIGAAADVVEAHLRKTQALVAIGRYDLAAKAFKWALKLHPQWANAEFSLDELYGEEIAFARAAHLEALEKAAEENPNDADLQLLLGMQHYYGGDKEKSLEFFKRAKRLGANRDGDDLPVAPFPGAADAAPRPMPPPDAD